MNLYILTSAQLAMQASLEAAGFDEETIADTLEGEDNTEALNEKRLGYIAIIKSKLALSNARLIAANDMAELGAAEERDAKRLEDALMASMKATGDDKIIGLQFQAIIRKNPPSVEIMDALVLPDAYWITPAPKLPVPAPDKAAIKKAFAAGVEVMGARMVQGTRLDIR